MILLKYILLRFGKIHLIKNWTVKLHYSLIFLKWNERNSKIRKIYKWNSYNHFNLKLTVNTHATDLLTLFFLFVCFCLRMKLSKASLAGKISDSERNFLSFIKSCKCSYVSGHLFLYFLPPSLFVCFKKLYHRSNNAYSVLPSLC